MDIEISKIISVRKFDDGARDFVYVEVGPDEPVECYEEEHDEEYIQKILDMKEPNGIQGYHVREEYGLWNGNTITRMEYDDGSAVIDGDVVSVVDEANLRIHFLTKSNFMICAKRSVTTNKNKEREYGRIMNSILKGEATVSDLINLVENTPRPQWFNRY